MRYTHLIASMIATVALSSHADIVYLTNGGVLEGKVTYEGNRIVIEQANGRITLPADKVDHVEKKETDVETFDKKLAELNGKKDVAAADFVSLAQFASEHNMRTRAELAYQKAIAIDTDNEAARQALGFVKFQGRWMSSDDANTARGLVKHNGAWVTPEALQDLLRAEVEADIQRARADLARAKAVLEQVKSDRLDKELELIEVERDRLRDYRSDVLTYLPSNYGPYNYKYGPAPAPVAAPQTKAPPPTTSIGSVQVDTPDGTVQLGPGGSLIVHHK
jgi:hypothetical protein